MIKRRLQHIVNSLKDSDPYPLVLFHSFSKQACTTVSYRFGIVKNRLSSIDFVYNTMIDHDIPLPVQSPATVESGGGNGGGKRRNQRRRGQRRGPTMGDKEFLVRIRVEAPRQQLVFLVWCFIAWNLLDVDPCLSLIT